MKNTNNVDGKTEFTVCTECKHLVSEGKIWYDNFCGARAVQSESIRSPYNGEMIYPDGRPQPYIREVNVNGKCPYYDKRSSIKML